MPQFEIITGQENFSTASAKMHVFLCRAEGPDLKEIHVGRASRTIDGAGGVLMALSRSTKELAAPGRRDDLGYWLTHRLEIRDGAILKVFGSIQRASGALKMMGAIYIRVRTGAALRRLSMTLTQHEWAGRDSAHIEGEMDILTVAEARDTGIIIPDQYAQFAERERFSRVFAEEIIRPETTTVEAIHVAVADADTTIVQVVHHPRRIKLRR